MKKINLRSLLYAGTCGFYAFCATAATSLFSDYGQIQNVQNYSTNPFWTPNGPYNQRLPQPVYVQGADLNADDCIKVVQSLVSVQCMARDNCKNTSLADIRPTIMVQLSNLPGNNYVSACSGYIDYIFETYVAQYGYSLPSGTVAFPGATTPNQGINGNNTIQIDNPYKIEAPKWYKEVKGRGNELKKLQQQNGAGSEHLTATGFPTTYADLSFTERMENAAAGYEPYKDASAYIIPQFKGAAEWCNGTEHANSPECLAYNDCTEEMRQSEPNVARATYTANRVCEIISCMPGYNRNITHDKCVEVEGAGGDNGGGNGGGGNGGGDNGGVLSTDCTAEAKSAVSQSPVPGAQDAANLITKAEKINGKCVITACVKGYKPDENKVMCVLDSEYLCSTTKNPISLSTQAQSIFAGAQVKSESIAKKLVEELLKCSTQPDFVVPDTNYFMYPDDIFVFDSTGQKIYDVKFASIQESNAANVISGTFQALCNIAQGGYYLLYSEKHCKNITLEQCKVIKTFMHKNVNQNAHLYYNQKNGCMIPGGSAVQQDYKPV